MISSLISNIEWATEYVVDWGGCLSLYNYSNVCVYAQKQI